MFALLLLAAMTGADPKAVLAAEIQQAQTLLTEGRASEAAQHFARLRDEPAVAGRDRVTVVSNLGIAQMQTGRLEAAETSFAEAERLLSAWPDEHRLWAALWNAEAMLARQRGRIQEARALYAQIEERTRTQAPSLYGISLGNRAELERTFGDSAEAERLARRAAGLTEGHHRLAAQHTLGLVLQTQGRVDEAAALLGEVWRERKSLFGAGSRAAAAAQASLGAAYIAQGRWADAQAMLSEARVLLETHAGPMSADVAAVWNNLAQVAKLTGRFAEADPLYRRALEIWARSCGKTSREYGLGLANFGDFFLAQGKGRGAAKLYDEAERILAGVLGDTHPRTQAVRLRRTHAAALREHQTQGHALGYRVPAAGVKTVR